MEFPCFATEHIETLPFKIQGGDDSVMYVRVGMRQYWRNPKGGWEVSDYQDVLDTIDRLEAIDKRRRGRIGR